MLRGGHQVVVESSQLVPGDVVVLEAGDAVPADGRLLESASLKIEEAALTGESVPVTKAVGLLTGDSFPWAIGRICAIWAARWSTAGARQ